MPASQQESTNEQVNFLRSSDPIRAQDNPGSEKSPWLRKGISKCLKEDKSDDPEVLFKLGVRYDTGDGVKENKKLAVRKYKKAAEQGHPQAQYNLGVSLFTGEGIKKDKRKAFEEFKKAAKEKDAFAQYAVGFCYDEGFDPSRKPDPKKAVKWYQKSADQGIILASVELALYHYWDDRDLKKAAELLENAVQQGLDEISKRMVTQQGLGKAQVCLGRFYYDGIGVEINKRKAVELFEMSSQQNDPSGLFNLGYCYENGEGISQNKDEAIKLYTQSASKGYQKAIERLLAIKILKK